MFTIGDKLKALIDQKTANFVPAPVYGHIAMFCGCTGNCGQSCSGGCLSGCSGECARSCSGKNS